MDGVRSWFDYMSSRTDLIVDGLTQTLMYVVVVTIAAGITAVVVAVLTMRHTFAKELALAISSVFLTIPSLALFTILFPSLASDSRRRSSLSICTRSCRSCETRRPDSTRSTPASWNPPGAWV